MAHRNVWRELDNLQDRVAELENRAFGPRLPTENRGPYASPAAAKKLEGMQTSTRELDVAVGDPHEEDTQPGSDLAVPVDASGRQPPQAG